MLTIKLLVGVAIATFVAHFTPIRTIGFLLAFSIILSIEILLNLVYVVYICPHILSPLRALPGPKGSHILFGQGVKEMIESPGVLVKKWEKSIPQTDFIRYLGFFGEEKLVPMTPDTARQLLTDDAIEFPLGLRTSLSVLLGDGLVLAHGPRHRRLKKIIGPAFTPSQQRYLVPSLYAVALELNKKLKEIVCSSGSQTVEVNMLEWTNRVTFDMIGATAWGSDFKGLSGPDDFYQLFDRNFPAEGFQGLDAFLCYVLPIFVDFKILNHLPIRRYQAQLEDRRLMHKQYREIISQSKFRKSEVSADGNHKDLLSVMLSNKEISEYDLMENMMTFTAAGYATNAASLVWAIYVLGTHPEIQAKLRTEIRSVLRTPGTPVTSTEMDAMKYLHCFVMENARLYPSIHTTWRQAMRPTVVNGVNIPKHTSITLSPFAMNRSEAVWGPDAEEFVPERWLPERRKPGIEHNGGFLTYAVGPKSCIGKEYSLRAIKAVIIGLVSEFEFSYEGQDPLDNLVPGLTLRPRGGLNVKVKMAEPW